MPSFNNVSSASFWPWTVNTSPTVVSWSHNNTGNFLVVFFEENSGVSITAKSATFNWVSMTAIWSNCFYLMSAPVWNYTLSVSLTHSSSWTWSGIAYVAASYSIVSVVFWPQNYTDTWVNWLNTISSSVALPSLWAWHVWCGFEYGNAAGITGSTSLRNSRNIPSSAQYIGIIDSNWWGSYPGNVSLTSTNTSWLNQWSRIVSFMIEQGMPTSPGFILL